jgi:translation elongation factor EF-Tu-like GTPase
LCRRRILFILVVISFSSSLSVSRGRGVVRRLGMTTDPLFRMTVQDVFSIAKRGTVVTGKIEAGTLRLGDEVVIRGRGDDRKAVVSGIEAFRKVLEQAAQGDNVGLLLKDVARQDVEAGDVIVSPGSDLTLQP